MIKNLFKIFSLFLFIYCFHAYYSESTCKYKLGSASIRSDIRDKRIFQKINLIVDSNFNLFERIFIEQAARQWELKTHVASFSIKINNEKDIFLDENSVYIYKISKSNPQVFALENNSSVEILGYYDKYSLIPSILIVSERLDDLNYTQIVMHEIGHAMGLKHNLEKGDDKTLMFPSINSSPSGITDKDIESFCKLYKC